MKNVSLLKGAGYDERAHLVRPALAPHQEHQVSINGYITNVPPLADRSDSDLAWRFLGYAVRCMHCLTSISEEWND